MMTLGRPTTSIEPDQSVHAMTGIGGTRCRANAVNFEQPISFPTGHMFGISTVASEAMSPRIGQTPPFRTERR